jgi:catechol 2,3-dioxygenase-like lactoylglutathione lyase family enzyme
MPERRIPLESHLLRTETGLNRGYHPGMSSDQSTPRSAMDWKLELVSLPVTDVDRAKAFYVDQLGFHADHDHRVNETLRFVQLTPPGSACSIAIGEGITTAVPGSVKGMQVVVADAQVAHDELAARGVHVSDVQDLGWGLFVFFSDPDGNGWALQQLPSRG